MADTFIGISLPFIIINSVWIILQILYLVQHKLFKQLLLRGLSKIRVNCCMQFLYLSIEVFLFLPPVVMYFTWGGLIVGSDDLSDHVGYGIMWLANGIHFFTLGILFFWFRNWRHSFKSVFCLINGCIDCMVYLYVVIAVPSIFSYTGAMAVYFASQYFNIVPIFYAIYSAKQKIRFSSFVTQMDSEGNQAEDEKTILNKAKRATRCSLAIDIGINLVFYLLEFGVIMLVIAIEAPTQYQALGFINSVILLLIDGILAGWLVLCQSPIFDSPTKGCLVFLLPRVMMCFFPDYYVLNHMLMFTLLLAIFGSMWIFTNIPVKTNEDTTEEDMVKSIAQFDKLSEHINEKEGVTVNFSAAQENKLLSNVYLSKVLAAIPTVLLFVIFLVYWLIIFVLEDSSRSDLKHAYPKQIKIEGRLYSQSTFGGLFFALLISFILIVLWFRLFMRWKKKVGITLIVLAICSTIIIIVVGIVYTASVLNKASSGLQALCYTSFICGPIVLFSTAIFFGIWSANDYFFYTPNYEPVPDSKVKPKEETKGNDLEASQSVHTEVEFKADEMETKEVRKLGATSRKGIWMLIPMGVNDAIILVCMILNLIAINTWFIVNTVLYDRKWLPVLIYLWTTIFLSGGFCIWKLYNTHFKLLDVWVIISLIMTTIKLIASLVVFLVYGFTQDSSTEAAKFFLAMFILHVGVPVLVGYMFGAVYIKERIKKHPWIKYVLLAIGWVLVLVVGIIAFVFKYYATGSALVIGAVMIVVKMVLDLQCIVKCTKPWVRKLVLCLVLAFCFLVTLILLAILMSSKNAAVMTMLSLLFYSCVGYSSVMYVLKFRENRLKAKKQIYVYTPQVIPMLKFVPNTSGGQGQMVADNDETIYFSVSVGGFFLWSLLAGMLFKTEDRYIGLSLSALSFAILTLYWYSRNHVATSIDAFKLGYISKKIYADLQEDALEYRKHLNQACQSKPSAHNVNQEGGESIFAQKKEILSILDEWEIFGMKVQKNLSGIFFIASLWTRLTRLVMKKEQTIEYTNDEVKTFDKDLADAGGKLDKRVSILLSSHKNSDREYSNNRKYNAYFLGQMKIYINSREEELQSVLRKILTDMKTQLKGKSEYEPLMDLLTVEKFKNIATQHESLFTQAFEVYQTNLETLEKERNQRLEAEQRKKDERERRLREQAEKKKEEERQRRDNADEERKKLEEEKQRLEEEKKEKEEEAKRLKEEEEERKRIAEEELQAIEDEEERTRLQEEEKAKQEEAQRLIDEKEKERLEQQQRMEQEKIRIEEQAEQLGGGEDGEVKVLKSGSEEDKEFVEKGSRTIDACKGTAFDDGDWTGKGALVIDPAQGYADDPSQWNDVDWVRVKDLVDDKWKEVGDRAVVFSSGTDGIDVNDIKQGGLGDCWFLSAIAGTAYSRPDLIKRIFHPKSLQYNEDGIYVLRFFKMGKQQTITIDDKLPADKNKMASFVSLNVTSTEVEFWTCLIEKAYAKLHGSFEAIEGGWTNEGYADLTGGISRNIMFDSKEFKAMKNNGSFWPMLMELLEEGHLLGISSKGTSDEVTNPQGVVEGHAYTLLDAQEIDGNRILQARNPWGQKEWTGKWGDSDTKNWTKKRVEQMRASQKERGKNVLELGPNDGVFWIALEDVFRNFDSLQICYLFQGDGWNQERIVSEWRGKTAGGCVNNQETFYNNPQFKLVVEEDADVIVHLAQPDARGSGSALLNIGFGIFENDGEPLSRYRSPVMEPENYMNRRDVMVKGKLKANTYTVLPSTFYPDKESEFTFSVYSKQSIKLQKF